MSTPTENPTVSQYKAVSQYVSQYVSQSKSFSFIKWTVVPVYIRVRAEGIFVRHTPCAGNNIQNNCPHWDTGTPNTRKVVL